MPDQAISYHHDKAGDFQSLYRAMRQDYWRSSFAYGRKKIEELLDETVAGIPAAGQVLDIGCGTGEHLHYFHERGLGATGLEPAANMRAIARQNNPGLPVLDGVATELPFSDRQFDLVVALEVFRYLHREDIQKAYREMMRVTKPGGLALFTMVNRYSLDGFCLYDSARRSVYRVLGRPTPPHCEFTTPNQVRSDLQQVGFSKLRCHGRMVGVLRLFYRINEPAAARLAKALEPWDDRVSLQPWSVPLAGHLIVTARR